jgi:nucleotide-binding universal stress UspA family protein
VHLEPAGTRPQVDDEFSSVTSSSATEMAAVRERPRNEKPQIGGFPAPRPVVLATLSVRVDPSAERVAIESALETRSRLIIANMLMLPPHPTTLMLAREYATLPHEEDLEAVRGTADRAAERGVQTELLRISSRRPLVALIELIREREAGLVVLGPDPGRTPRWWLWLAARRVRRQAACLVWIAPDGQ